MDDTLVLEDGSMFTVRGSTLELRGDGWERRRRRDENEGCDLARICHLESEAQAREIAEKVAAATEIFRARERGSRNTTAQESNDGDKLRTNNPSAS